MGLKLETKKQNRKFDVALIRTCCRSICNHPFLVGMVFSLIFLYRTFPFLFSLLVHASPVLVCTAVLLGTLLSFGQSNNIHETEKQDYHSHGIDSLKPGVSEGEIVVVKRDECLFEGKRSDTVENSIEETSSTVIRINEVEDDHVPSIKEVEKESNGGVKGVLHNENAAADQNSLVQENGSEILEVEVDNSLGLSAKDDKQDHLDSSALVNESENDDEDDEDGDNSENKSLHCGSDRAESSSLDGSVADMVPMLDEIHPLLFKEDPQPPRMPSDAMDNGESDENSDSHGEVEDDGVDDNEDDEEEEGAGVKEDESKSAIKWTEDDQKNLMDLGTLEIERNQCLENLIARRRARLSSKTMVEKNLIDFETADFPFNVAPLSVKKRNPFELPFESKEEKTDNNVDGFEQQFTKFHQKEVFFRRHESFSLGPSSLGFVRQEDQDIKWRPVFIPERFVSEGASYSSFSRQSSGVSDSKLSSIPDSESVSSVEQDFSKEKEMISNIYQTHNLFEHGSQSAEDVVSEEMVQIEKKDAENVGLEITLGKVENHSETEVENHSETEVENHSETEVENHSKIEVENHSETEVENHSETESSLSETEEEDNVVQVENKTSETHLKTEPVEEENCSRSSPSSVSEEVDEKDPSHVQNDDGSSSLEAKNGDHINGVVNENLPEEPVYDSSPTAAGKLLSLSSVFSDNQTEILENVKPPESEEMAMVHGDKKDENSHPK